MNDLQIFVFGKFQVQCGACLLKCFEARKVQELFCYLLLNRSRSHPRETLADLLWQDYTTAQSKGYLRKTLWQLQSSLEVHGESGDDSLLIVDSDWIQINPKANFWLDVAVFEQTFNLVQGVPGREIDGACAQTLRYTVDLYRGNLLEGWYTDWCLYERERFQHMYLAMLDKLMDYSEAHHQYEAGIIYGMGGLRYDRARERAHRQLMRLRYLAGDRTAALRQYEQCAIALREELGVEPAKQTTVLYEQIRADRLEFFSQSPVVSSSPLPAPKVPWSGILAQLKQLQATLSTFESQIQENIQKIEQAMMDHR